jgi:hypothetical protein
MLLGFSCIVYTAMLYNFPLKIIHLFHSYTGFIQFVVLYVFLHENLSPTYYKSHLRLLLSLAMPTNNYILLYVKAVFIDWQINGFTYNKILSQT